MKCAFRFICFQLLIGFALVSNSMGQSCCDSGCAGSTLNYSPSSADAVTSDSTSSPSPQFNFNTQDVAFSGSTFAGIDSKAGYIDPALIATQLRFRFDAAYGFNRPERAEYYYTTWTAFGGRIPNPQFVPDPNLDRQSISLMYEHAFSQNFSVFADLPVVYSNPELNPNESGLGDMTAGFKVSLYHDCANQLTFQLKNYIPTGESRESWLGTGHYSIEPGILLYRDLGRGWSLEGEIKDWISIGGAVNPNNGRNYAGNILQYGLGVGVDAGCIGNYRVKPIVEFVGWSVLEGQVFDFDRLPRAGVVDADGDTIVNLKIGARLANACGGSFYAGYGHSLTGDRWYEEIFRLEFRRIF